MILAGYIERVRAKTEAEKRPIVFAWAAGLTFLVFLIWALTFSLSIVNREARKETIKAQAEAAAAVEVAPAGILTKLTGAVGQTLATVSDGFWVAVGLMHR